MKLFIRSLLIVLGLVGLLVFVSSAAATSGPSERIQAFSSHIVVHPNGSVTVTETIKVWAEGREIRRGILRDFPTTYKDRYGNRVRVGFDVQKVLRDGQHERYRVESLANGKRIRIGQKRVFLSRGEHTYVIKYRTDRQVGFFDTFDELYWNATGTEWTFPIDWAQAVIELPPGASVVQTSAYTGPFGAKGTNYRESWDSYGRVVFTTKRPLGVKEGLTIAVAWDKGFVAQPILGRATYFFRNKRATYFFRHTLPAFLGPLWLAILVGYYLVVWNRVGRGPEKGVIIPIFEPPPSFSPAATRFLMRLGFDNKAFTAAVVDMAVKGHLTIAENNGDYTLIKRFQDKAPLSSGERKISNSLFPNIHSYALKLENQNHSIISKARDALEYALNAELTQVYFLTSWRYLIWGLILTALALPSVVLASPVIKANFPLIAVVVVVCSVMTVYLFRKWKMADRGLIELLGALGAIVGVLFCFFVMFMFMKVNWSERNFHYASPAFFLLRVMTHGGGFFFLGIVLTNVFFFYWLKVPTLKGRRVMDQIEGFKLYLSVAEKERLEILHPAEKTPELYEKYLPYALALDVENEWSEQFAEVLAQAQVESRTYSPTWYSGSSWGSLSPSSFSDTLGSSFADAISSASIPPGSSSWSGGGGFSGGGGGGGGGSGW
jgi:uncharacterized membrane protein YgcG